MKIRLKFRKQGNLRFIGHLDVMRTFQKINRRAGIDIRYSAGFSPHQQMSFATPLGLGLTSDAEYVDYDMLSVPGKEAFLRQMNEHNVEELKILDACLLPDDAKNAMSLLAASDYLLTFREGCEPEDYDDFFEDFRRFLDQEHIPAVKKTKTGTQEVDLIRQIRKFERRGNAVFLRLDTGSRSNCKPEFVMETFYRSLGKEWSSFTFHINREELYGEENGELKALIDYGTEF
ncbi:MAG: DUF2344 domain-containing protein [Lachnospiraceae bacterium]|nr:DUF2344 domain-containing protein [Lachnospiraceae bacterium]